MLVENIASKPGHRKLDVVILAFSKMFFFFFLFFRIKSHSHS